MGAVEARYRVVARARVSSPVAVTVMMRRTIRRSVSALALLRAAAADRSGNAIVAPVVKTKMRPLQCQTHRTEKKKILMAANQVLNLKRFTRPQSRNNSTSIGC